MNDKNNFNEERKKRVDRKMKESTPGIIFLMVIMLVLFVSGILGKL